MAALLPHTGNVVYLPNPDPSASDRGLLLQTERVKVCQIKVGAGQSNPEYVAFAETVLYCAEGRVAVRCGLAERVLPQGGLLYLAPREPHAIRGIEDSLLLAFNFAASEPRQQTVAGGAASREAAKLPEGEAPPRKDPVQEASEESFPASDPPSWTPVTSP